MDTEACRQIFCMFLHSGPVSAPRVSARIGYCRSPRIGCRRMASATVARGPAVKENCGCKEHADLSDVLWMYEVSNESSAKLL